MNFYINIERLKNLKISQNKEQDHKRTKSSQASSNPYISRDKLNVERRSELLRRYNGKKQHHQSQEQIYQSVNRVSQ